MAARCQFLANVPLLQPLSHQQISKIAEAMSVEEFGVGDYVRARHAARTPLVVPPSHPPTRSPTVPLRRSSAKASVGTSSS